MLFQETAQLEARAYELEQKTAVAAEAKTVLDSWVRYEGQVKARQQRELAESVIARIEKELENPKVLDQILKQSVQDVESMFECTHVSSYELTNFTGIVSQKQQ
jgi:F-type H+-transporting ATPase subunit b